MRRPTRTERDNVAAWLAHNDQVDRQGRAMLRVLFAVIVGVLATLALVHWATPCAEATLCLAPCVRPAWPAWLRRQCRRLHALVLRTRLQQLLGTAQQMALDPTQRADTPLRMGAVLAKAAALRLHIEQLDRADAAERRARAARA